MKEYIIATPSGEIIELDKKTLTLFANKKMLVYNAKIENWTILDSISNAAKDLILFIESFGIKDIKMNSKGKLTLIGNVNMKNYNIEKFDFTLKIEHIEGSFDCSHNKLKTLNGSPNSVSEKFDCSNNFLINLDGGPMTKVGDYICSDNKLRTLLGAPKDVYGDFDCSNNDLTNLNYIPQIYGNIYVTNNYIKNLSMIDTVYGDLDISYNDFESLDSLPRIYGDLFCQGYVMKPGEIDKIKSKVDGKIIN